MNPISASLSSLSSIQKNLPFNLSSLDKRILLAAAAIFAVIEAIFFAYRTWNDPIKAYRLERSKKELDKAIAMLKQDPSKPPRVDIENLLKLAKTHGSEIKNLDIHYFSPEITEEQFIEVIKLCPNLESLKVISIKELHNSCGLDLGKLTKLQKFSLVCPQITDFQFLSNLTNLQELFIHFETIEDNTLEPLKDLTSLKSLTLGYKKNITEKSLQPISRLTNLEKLHFSHSTDSSVSNMCPHISDAHLIHLGDLTHLKSLTLSSSQITGSGLASLGKLTSLEFLDIRYCKNMTDQSLDHLKKMVGLKHIKCEGNDQLTPQCLVHFASLPALQSLSLVWCDKISMNDVRQAGITCNVLV